jgi:hypothetical protein
MFGGLAGLRTGGADLLRRLGGALGGTKYHSPYGGGFGGILNDLTMLRYGPGVKRTSNAPLVPAETGPGPMNPTLRSPDIAAPGVDTIAPPRPINKLFNSQRGSMNQNSSL